MAGEASSCARQQFYNSAGNSFQCAVIVAMVAMHVMQAAIDKVIQMLPVRNSGVSAMRAMDMPGIMPFRPLRAAIGIGSRHFNDMLIRVIPVGVMQMTVAQIIRMALMLDRNVSAAGAMPMLAVLMPDRDIHGKFLVNDNEQTHEVPGKVPLREELFSYHHLSILFKKRDVYLQTGRDFLSLSKIEKFRTKAGAGVMRHRLLFLESLLKSAFLIKGLIFHRIYYFIIAMNGFVKHASAFMVVWMLAMQLLLAHHYTVHFSGESHAGIEQHAPGHDSPQKDHHEGAVPDGICQICAFSKALSQSLGAAGILLLTIFLAVSALLPASSAVRVSASLQPYSARAPPALS